MPDSMHWLGVAPQLPAPSPKLLDNKENDAPSWPIWALARGRPAHRDSASPRTQPKSGCVQRPTINIGHEKTARSTHPADNSATLLAGRMATAQTKPPAAPLGSQAGRASARWWARKDRKSTRMNSSHVAIS